MSTLNTQARHLRSTVSKIVMVFTFAVVIGGISLAPALGQENERRQRPQWPGAQRSEQRERGWQARERQGERRWQAREWRGERPRQAREWRGERRRRGYPLYYNTPPLYVPPPVVYAPLRPPGISLFFPLHIR